MTVKGSLPSLEARIRKAIKLTPRAFAGMTKKLAH
jgi:hypothetical protein